MKPIPQESHHIGKRKSAETAETKIVSPNQTSNKTYKVVKHFLLRSSTCFFHTQRKTTTVCLIEERQCSAAQVVNARKGISKLFPNYRFITPPFYFQLTRISGKVRIDLQLKILSLRDCMGNSSLFLLSLLDLMRMCCAMPPS